MGANAFPNLLHTAAHLLCKAPVKTSLGLKKKKKISSSSTLCPTLVCCNFCLLSQLILSLTGSHSRALIMETKGTPQVSDLSGHSQHSPNRMKLLGREAAAMTSWGFFSVVRHLLLSLPKFEIQQVQWKPWMSVQPRQPECIWIKIIYS